MSGSGLRNRSASGHARRRRWPLGAIALIAASLPASTGETYRFFGRLGDWDEVTSSAGAHFSRGKASPRR